ncbi:MAG: lysostaphin resistance A-like protein [Planctomycetota bacterium]
MTSGGFHVEGETHARSLGALAFLAYAPMTAIGGGVMYWRAPSTQEFVARLFGSSILLDMVLGLATGALVVGCFQLAKSRSRELKRLERTFVSLLGSLNRQSIMLLAATSAVGEEVLFRGALQPVLGLGWTALLFGLLHFPFRRELWCWPVFAGLAGLLLGWLYDREGSLLAPIAAHFAINAISLELISRRAGRVRGVRVASNGSTRS